MMKFLAVLALFLVAQGHSANVRYGRDLSSYKPGWMRFPEIQKILDDAIAKQPNENGQGKIVGGQEAKPHSYPHQVGLFIDNEYFCGGSIISDEWILTAGHCTHLAQSVVVVAGAHAIQQHESTQVKRMASADDITTHPGFNLTIIANDLGVIKLKEKLKFNDNIKSVKLGTKKLEPRTMVTPTGWGKMSDQATGISPTLREVTVPTIDTETCKKTFDVVTNQICIDSKGGKGTCNGDSGGPLNYEGKTYGITSFGSGLGCQAGLPDAFTSVMAYASWIEKTTGVKP